MGILAQVDSPVYRRSLAPRYSDVAIEEIGGLRQCIRRKSTRGFSLIILSSGHY